MVSPITPSGDDEQAKTVGEKITCICGQSMFSRLFSVLR